MSALFKEKSIREEVQAVKISTAPSETTGSMGQRRENGSVVAKHDQRHITGGRLEEKFRMTKPEFDYLCKQLRPHISGSKPEIP